MELRWEREKGNTFVLDNRPDAMEETFELRVGRTLVIDELDFNSFHRSDGEYSFSHAGAKTAEQTLTRS